MVDTASKTLLWDTKQEDEYEVFALSCNPLQRVGQGVINND
jgi:hypothetical protein